MIETSRTRSVGSLDPTRVGVGDHTGNFPHSLDAHTWCSAIRKARAEEELSFPEIVALLESEGDRVQELFAVADVIRRRYVGEEIHIRGIVEFSNHCRLDCLYCGLRRSNRSLTRYRMPLEEIVECARMAQEIGFKSLVLQSGEDPWYTVERVERLVKAVKSAADVAITLSIGERPRDEYRRMRLAGADRFLLKHETADEGLYRSLHPDSVYAERVQCLRSLREVGFEVGSGSMVGLPGQTLEMMARDIILLRDLAVDMAGIGPFIPNPKTPLGDAATRSRRGVPRTESRSFSGRIGRRPCPPGGGVGSGSLCTPIDTARSRRGGRPCPPGGGVGSDGCCNPTYTASEKVNLTLKMIALARIVTRDAHLPATTALSTIDPLGREKAWRAGANVVMPNVTPIRYREHYQIYPDKACLFDETKHCWKCLHGRIASVGRRPGRGYGHSYKDLLASEITNESGPGELVTATEKGSCPALASFERMVANG